MLELLISIVLGFAIANITFLSFFDDSSMLEKRLRKIAKKQRHRAKSIAKNIAEIIGSYGADTKKNKTQIARTKLLLMQAGEDSNDDTVLIYEGRKIIALFISFIMFLIIMSFFGFSLPMWAGTIIGLLIVYKAPDMLLRHKIKSRQRDFVKNLPDAIDLLSICIKAGLGLDAALNKVANEFALTSKVVAREFERLNRDVLSGLTKQEAYRNMAICNPNSEVKSFVALLIQTDKLGTSITQSLDAYCDSVRTRKRQRIEEYAQQAAGKMTIPMVLFMLPAIFLIILYPALVKISTNMSF